MSIMDFFRTPAVPAPQQQQQQQPQNGQQQQPANPSLTQQQPADPTAATVEQTKVDPMDTFKDLWTAPAKVEGQEEDFNPSAIFNIDPATMQQAIGKINFAEGITADQLQAIQGGGEEAIKAFAAVLNTSSAKAMQLSTTAAAKMVEQAMTRASGAMDKKIASGVKLNQVSSAMQELNPALTHPAAAPLVNALKEQFTNKHPTATPTEITTMISSYLDNFAGIAAGKKEDPAATAAAAEAAKGTDWAAYFGGNTN